MNRDKLSAGRDVCPKCMRKGLGYARHPGAYNVRLHNRATCRYCHATLPVTIEGDEMKKPKAKQARRAKKDHFFTLGIRKEKSTDYLSRFVLTVTKQNGGGLSMSFVQVPTKALQFNTREAAMVAHNALDMFSDGFDLDLIEHLV